MLNLEPVVTRFLDDLLRAIRRASLAELCEAMEASGSSPSSARARRSARRLPAPSGQVQPPRATTAQRESLRRKPRSRRLASTRVDAHAVGEITEPDRLLAVVTEQAKPQRDTPNSDGVPPDPSPESESVEPAVPAQPPPLRLGEAAVALKGATYVIRRARTKQA